MGPVWQAVQMPVDIEALSNVVEAVPCPNGIPVLVQVNYAIPNHRQRSRIPGRSVKFFE